MLDDEAIELMVANGTYLVADLYDGNYILEHGPDKGYSEEVLRKTDMTNDAQGEGFAKALEAGVRIAFRTDASVFPHGLNGRQFNHYGKNGMRPERAIQSATRWAAELMGWEDRVGSISSGTFADIDGNPVHDITTLENVDAVMKSGVWLVAP
jgi:imidazolonepropionase-like amidohydrolase